MQRALRPSALVPRGFDVESASCDGATTVIIVRPMSDTSPCPGCRARSKLIHSRYQRRLADCRWPDGRFGLWSWRGVSVAIRFFAIDGYLPSASMTAL
jgi:hypothetical protein